MSAIRRLSAFLLVMLLFGVGWVVQGVAAAPEGGNYVVTRLDDPAPDGCAANDCTLREAVIAANTDAGFSLITFAISGTVELSRIGMYDDEAVTGDLDLVQNDQILGLGPENTIVDANGLDRVFDLPAVPPSAMPGDGAMINSLTMTGGNTNSDSLTAGGGIRIMPGRTLSLIGVVVRDNDALGGVAGVGGGIANEGGTVDIVSSAIINNEGDNAGGVVNANGTMTILNSTVSGNHPRFSVGGILNVGATSGVTATLSLVNVTVAYNIEPTPQSSGAGLDTSIFGGQGAAVTTVQNSIIANNSGDDQCYSGGSPSGGQIISDGYNISGDDSCSFSAGSDMQSTDPLLGALVPGAMTDGGTTFFHPLSNSSPALDSGSASVITDQRNNPRPVDLPGIPNSTDGDDRGAIEMGSEPPSAVTLAAMTAAGNSAAIPLWTVILGLCALGIVLCRRSR